MLWFYRFAASHISLYRPERVVRIEWRGMPWPDGNGGLKTITGWWPEYEVGDLRARLFGVRVPILWAWDCLIFGGVVKPPHV